MATQASGSLQHMVVSSDRFAPPPKIEQPSSPRPDYRFKVHLWGAQGVGKDTLIQRYCYDASTVSKHGPVFHTKTQKIGDKLIELQLWPVSSRENARFVGQCFRGAQIALYVFDATNLQSFQSINDYLEDEKYYSDESCLNFLVASKVDLVRRRVVTSAEAIEFANQNKMAYIETSAQENVNVVELFARIAQDKVRQLAPPPVVTPRASRSDASDHSCSVM